MSNSDIWCHFIKLGKSGGYKQNRASCKYCNYELNETFGRCKQHLKKCSSVPHSVIQSLFGPNYTMTTSSLFSSSSSFSSIIFIECFFILDSGF